MPVPRVGFPSSLSRHSLLLVACCFGALFFSSSKRIEEMSTRQVTPACRVGCWLACTMNARQTLSLPLPSPNSSRPKKSLHRGRHSETSHALSHAHPQLIHSLTRSSLRVPQPPPRRRLLVCLPTAFAAPVAACRPPAACRRSVRVLLPAFLLGCPFLPFFTHFFLALFSLPRFLSLQSPLALIHPLNLFLTPLYPALTLSSFPSQHTAVLLLLVTLDDS